MLPKTQEHFIKTNSKPNYFGGVPGAGGIGGFTPPSIKLINGLGVTSVFLQLESASSPATVRIKIFFIFFQNL